MSAKTIVKLVVRVINCLVSFGVIIATINLYQDASIKHLDMIVFTLIYFLFIVFTIFILRDDFLEYKVDFLPIVSFTFLFFGVLIFPFYLTYMVGTSPGSA